MMLVGLHGRAGAGKDTLADRLVSRHGVVKRGFADPLHAEVAAAFKVDVAWLKDRDRKEQPQDLLRLVRCYDEAFRAWANRQGHGVMSARSPREVLQLWGTEYRRSQSETYWLEKL